MSQDSVERVRPPLVADESTMLTAWLGYHRETLARLLSVGARPVDIGQGDVSWQVLADPEGHEFCLLRSTVAPG